MEIGKTPFNGERQIINLFWTGGFESSFRMVQLSKYNVIVQPHYIFDDLRDSSNHELKAIESIASDIRNHPDSKSIILPLIRIHKKDIKPDKSITDAFKRLKELSNIGNQYDWLARYAKSYPGLELCVEKGEMAMAYLCILQNGAVKKIKSEMVPYCIVDKEKSSADLVKVFGLFHYPSPLFGLTKVEIMEEYRKLGFEHIVKKTWFCHNPVNDETCGVCNPCRTVITEGLAYRVTPEGIKRFQQDQKYGQYSWYRFIKKIRRRMVGY